MTPPTPSELFPHFVKWVHQELKEEQETYVEVEERGGLIGRPLLSRRSRYPPP